MFGQLPTASFLLRPGRDSLPDAVPVLVSRTFLDQSNTRVGQTIPLALFNGTVTVRIAGSFVRFPTVDPAAPTVVADLPTYLDAFFGSGSDVKQPSEWLLSTGPGNGDLAGRLRAPPFRSIEVVSRSEQEHALLEDPVPLGVIGALALGFVAAAAFAAAGFAASTMAVARQRLLEFAVLRSLGLRTRQLTAWIGLESVLVVGLSLLGGAALGLLVSWLVLPHVALGDTGAAAVPPVRLVIPWRSILWLELILLGALGAIAAFQLHVVHRLRLAPTLRSGEGGVAQ